MLASELQQTEFLTWIDKELDGYSERDKPLGYRIVNGTPQGYRNWVWGPLKYTDTKNLEVISHMAVGQSIGEFEEILNYKGNYFILKFPPTVENILKDHFKEVADFRLSIGRSEITKILDYVRNAILSWCIELKKSGVSDTVAEFTAGEVREARVAMPKYHIEHIDHFTGNIGDNNFVSNQTSVNLPEGLWSKVFWYVIIPLIVLVIGAWLLKRFGISTN